VLEVSKYPALKYTRDVAIKHNGTGKKKRHEDQWKRYGSMNLTSPVFLIKASKGYYGEKTPSSTNFDWKAGCLNAKKLKLDPCFTLNKYQLKAD
jgi:hypothetical protein